MAETPTIKRIMTPVPFVIDAAASILTARSKMDEHRIRHLPVVSGGRLAGVLSDRDVALVLAHREDLDSVTAGSTCTADPFAVPPTEPLERVVTAMADRHIGCVVVVEESRVLGIVTTTDVCRFLGALLRRMGDPPAEPPPFA